VFQRGAKKAITKLNIEIVWERRWKTRPR
jgi:hypothetical protein